MPLEYFLGENENAIKIQIWCTLIADLLLKVVASQLKRKWAFSNLASFVRLHLLNYTHLFKFLEHPERCKIHTDCLIAGIALTNGLQLVTNNMDHFKRIKSLEIVNC